VAAAESLTLFGCPPSPNATAALSPRLAPTMRGRIRRLFERYNRSYTAVTEQNWNYETDTLEDLGGELRDLYGADHLPGDGLHGFSIVGFIADAPAECIFDALEFFAAREEALGFAAALNEVLAEEEAAWRMLDSEMVLLDDAFARSELAARADDSIRRAGFAGALSELRAALATMSWTAMAETPFIALEAPLKA
jgi:hypothetical protein